MNLSQGAVSAALLAAAGPQLQAAVRSEARTRVLKDGEVVATAGFGLTCLKVFHVVCPSWDNGGGRSEKVSRTRGAGRRRPGLTRVCSQGLTSIIRRCLEQAEKLKMSSLSFPVIGAGNLGFPPDLVARILLREIHGHSSSRAARHLRRVAVVVHPSDRRSLDVSVSQRRRRDRRRQTC